MTRDHLPTHPPGDAIMLTIDRQGRLTDDAVSRYRSQGFLHVPQVLTSEEVRECLTEAHDLFRRSEKAIWDQDDGTVMDWVYEAENRSEVMRRLALHPLITAIAEQLAGTPLRMFKTELLRKPAGSAPTPEHVDDVALPFVGRPVTLTAWVALTDVPVQRGCMSFLPTSHLRPDGPTTGTPADWTPLVGEPGLAFHPRTTVPLRAGDCTFHVARVVHAAGANVSESDRLSLATVYMDAEAQRRHCPIPEFDDDCGGLAPGDALDGPRFPLLSGR